MNKPVNIHGTGLVVGEVGVLLRGPPGAGKSLLALALIDRAEGRGEAAALLSDDRVDLFAERGAVWMQAPLAIAGLIELRGRGIVMRPSRVLARLDLVIDVVPERVRMLEDEELATYILEQKLARAPVPRAGQVDLGHQVLLVVEAIRALGALEPQP